ncbi:hypothetical protein PanWU01x14_149620 [Parasponia andersonii]|uniref:Uncharacterized protein n=1 Tax=Parasponia andersonii TaxID=3476 RepID=A0A2P5CIH7_PARAD|nr:hypothetical protein PanWU01x14_149620 [Parasponia andersonii]
MAVSPNSKCNRVECAESLGFLRIDHTLWRGNLVSKSVITVRVCHVLPPEALHLDPLRRCDTSRDRFGTSAVVTLRKLFNWIDCAAMEDKVGERGHIGLDGKSPPMDSVLFTSLIGILST